MGGAARGSAPGRLIARPSPLGTAAALTLALLGSAFVPRPAAARTWQVAVDASGDAPTIQAGIDSAAVGDTVLVGPGTYWSTVLEGFTSSSEE